MTNQPGRFLDIKNANDPETIDQNNWEICASEIYKRKGTYQSGVVNTIVGPPTSGARVLDEVWRDSKLALFICTVAGTPGTWKQLEPAVMDSIPSSPPTGYWIVRRDLNFRGYRYTGSAWVEINAYRLSATPSLAYSSIADAAHEVRTFTLAGTSVGDIVLVGFMTNPPTTGIAVTGYVSATDTVALRLYNYTAGAINPGTQTFNVAVICF